MQDGVIRVDFTYDDSELVFGLVRVETILVWEPSTAQLRGGLR